MNFRTDLTRDLIVNEPPGPTLDLWIAVHVFNWIEVRVRPAHWGKVWSIIRSDNKIITPHTGPWYLPPGVDVDNGVQPPAYSTDMNAAWEIAKFYRSMSGRAALYIDGHSVDYADCAIRDGTYMAYGDFQAAEALCKAALLERHGFKHPRHYKG